MRVLLLFPMADKQTGSAIKHAFEKLDHVVKAVDVKNRIKHSYKIACKFKPDLVFCSRTNKLAKQVMMIKKKFPEVIACVWNVDTRYNINYWERLFSLIKTCDYYFVVASKLIPEWRKINPNTFWLPQGVQNESYNKPNTITEKDEAKYSSDVSWAGKGREGFHKIRGPFLDTIIQAKIDFKQWGCAGNPKIYNEDHNKMVSLSKINLAISGWPKNEKYTSVRNYKILGAGGFLLELYRKGIYEIFPENIFDCYKSPDDLVEKIRYWLKNERERKEYAERGYKWVHENATYTHRIKMALEYMGMA